MLKKASTLLPLFFSLWISNVIGQAHTDTVNKVSIKITVKEKTETLINIPKTPKKLSKKSIPKDLKNNKSVPTTLNKTKTVARDSNLEAYSRNLPDSSIKIIHPKDKTGTTINRLKAKKNIQFLISFLLIVTGTLLAVFYRAGIPLVIAILLLVAGYYILIYTLVFMA